MVEKGVECDLDTIEAEIKERDHRDMTRENSPLKKADDAVEVDSSYMTIEEVADKIISLYEAK
jgi:cytidylate kinase